MIRDGGKKMLAERSDSGRLWPGIVGIGRP